MILLTDEPPTPPNPITHIAQWTLLLMMLVAIGAMFTASLADPDHVSGKVSDDAGWVK